MAGRPISSKNGALAVSGVVQDDVTNVSVNVTDDAQAYNSSDTACYTNRVSGMADCTITWTHLADQGEFSSAPYVIGQIMPIMVTSSGTSSYSGVVVITDISNALPIGDGGIVTRDITASQRNSTIAIV